MTNNYLVDLTDFDVDVRYSGEVVFINNEIYSKQEILELAKRMSTAASELIEAITCKDLK